MPLWFTPVESAHTPRVGTSTPWSGSPHKRFLPQPLGCLHSSGPGWRRPSLWWWVATRVSPALGEGLAGTDPHWRPALTICQLSSWWISVMYSSGHWWGHSLGASNTPPSALVLPCPEYPGQWTLEGSWWRLFQGHFFGHVSLLDVGVPSCVSFSFPPLHSCHIAKQMLQ